MARRGTYQVTACRAENRVSDNRVSKQVATNIKKMLASKEIMPLGDFEKSMNISRGYLSRIAGNQDKRISIDFVVKAAKVLGTNVEILISGNSDHLMDNTKLLCDFLKKLGSSTYDGEITWSLKNPDTYSVYLDKQKVEVLLNWVPEMDYPQGCKTMLMNNGQELIVVYDGSKQIIEPIEQYFEMVFRAAKESHTGNRIISPEARKIIDEFLTGGTDEG